MVKEEFLNDNLEIHEDKNNVIVTVNPKIYPLNTIFSAAYVLVDKAWVIIDGDPIQEIVVQLKRKDPKIDLEELGRSFNNELINYSVYNAQVEKNAVLRGMIIQKAFETQSQESKVKKQERRRIVRKRKGRRK